ncbi:hypothetical protein [Mangrovimonas sp. ST2L15]|uniref:hypothetical protein n=1 Tax=Mangrovimonas sp. ST2L15 TaxID=1645916 RepID=UPI0006B61BDA|nr:hypothetical protein [Mangrovimonas sp. ST2L15]
MPNPFKTKEDIFLELAHGYLNNKDYFHDHLEFLLKENKVKYGVSNLQYLKNGIEIVLIELEELKKNNSPIKTLSIDVFQGSYLKSIAISRNELKALLKNLEDITTSIQNSSAFLPAETTSQDENRGKNFPPDVFSSSEAQELFIRYIQDYGNNKTKESANFSFLFFAMKRTKLIHCTQNKFMEELSKYNIHLDQINGRQSLPKNHEKYIPFKYLYRLVMKSEPLL